MLDVDHNVNNEAEGPFECVYVKIRTNLCCSKVYFMYDSVYSHYQLSTVLL